MYWAPDGAFSVLLPAPPRLSSQESKGKNGEPFTQYMTQARDDTTYVLVAYFNYGPTIKFVLDDAVDGMVGAVKGTLLSREPISLGGFRGQQASAEAKTESGIPYMVRARVYDVNRRVYSLQCLSPKATDPAAIAEKCERFLNSFKVKGPQ